MVNAFVMTALLGIVIPIDWERTTRPLEVALEESNFYVHTNTGNQTINPPADTRPWTFDTWVVGDTPSPAAPWSTPPSTIMHGPDPTFSINIGNVAIPVGHYELVTLEKGLWAQWTFQFVNGVLLIDDLTLTPTESWKYWDTSTSSYSSTFSRTGSVLASLTRYQYVLPWVEDGGGDDGGGEEEP